MNECVDSGNDTECEGEVMEYTSRSGATRSFRCARHQDAYEVRMDAVYRDVQSRYPGFDVPGSSPPDWFDPTYAGESWDDD